MQQLILLTKRNIKMFFKDKVMFFTSLITPAILLVLYATFLARVFKDSFITNFNGLSVSNKTLNALVGGQLISSLLSVTTITVAFCSNMLMVQDKANGTIKDIAVSSVKPNLLALSYFLATVFTTLIVSFTSLILGLGYLAIVGWELTFLDVVMLILDTILAVLFGTALSSIIHSFLSTQGQISAVGTIVSAGYGFICGAYMPISSFSVVLQKILIFFPGTYLSNLFRIHSVGSAIESIQDIPPEVLSSLKQGIDAELKFFGTTVTPTASLIVVACSTILLIGVYLLIATLKNKKSK